MNAIAKNLLAVAASGALLLGGASVASATTASPSAKPSVSTTAKTMPAKAKAKGLKKKANRHATTKKVKAAKPTPSASK
jgi:hypothetical protein